MHQWRPHSFRHQFFSCVSVPQFQELFQIEEHGSLLHHNCIFDLCNFESWTFLQSQNIIRRIHRTAHLGHVSFVFHIKGLAVDLSGTRSTCDLIGVPHCTHSAWNTCGKGFDQVIPASHLTSHFPLHTQPNGSPLRRRRAI